LKDKAHYIEGEQWIHFFEDEKQAMLQRIAEGDEDVFTRLFQHYYTLLRPFVWKFTQSAADTEEILQETLIRVWLSRDKLPGIDNLHSWIFTIASRQCLSAMRVNLSNRKKMVALEQRETTKVIETPADSAQVAELTRLVGEAVSQMPPQRQRIYRMSREEGLKPAAIAVILSLSVHTVKNVLVTALKEIRDQLTAAGHLVSFLYILFHFL
jgi:RNA polymerase sigma factor (sigma-70 family)